MAIPADTIAAIATAPGRGGVGIVRLSGTNAKTIAQSIAGALPPERHARHTIFRSPINQEVIDDGLLLVFSGPNSYTGEDVVEFQGHGGSVVLDILLETCLNQGARLAKPGEFTERAFLNGRMDLTQAEAVADLIDATNTAAVRAAQNTLQGKFGQQVDQVVRELIDLRVYIESALDFAEEEIDFLSDDRLTQHMRSLNQTIFTLLSGTQHGILLREGIKLAIVGAPNAGKSSLLNQMTGEDLAIVTPIAGTTRDVLRAAIHLDGIPIHLIDTAGIRDSDDPIEQEGIRRARKEIDQAQIILWLHDDQHDDLEPTIIIPAETPVLRIRNKIDLTGKKPGFNSEKLEYAISAKTGAGISDIKDAIKKLAGVGTVQDSGQFTARRRHLDALNEAARELQTAQNTLETTKAGELCAESLRRAQMALEGITGRYTSDDLLGEIFSKFCIGK